MSKGNTTYQIQYALRSLGFPPGPVDGIPGAKTSKAIRAYQQARRLEPDGIVGPKTLAALKRDGYQIVQLVGKSAEGWANNAKASDGTRPWLDYARDQIGVAEIPGPRHSPTILGWLQQLGAKALGMRVTDDETAWCGTFVGICLLIGLPNEPLPAILIRAKEWMKFGVPLRLGALGAVCVFDRAGGGHVGFYEGEDETHIHVLGGNQGNRVSRMRLEKARLIGYRWPSSVPLPTSGIVRLSPNGTLVSANEA